MSSKRKATFYMDESVHLALRLKAANDDTSPSAILNALLKKDLISYLEDLEDIATVKSRKRESKMGIPLEKFKRTLK
jgi:hypothetical protein